MVNALFVARLGHTVVVDLRKEPYDVYIGRAGHGHDGYFGNPIALRKESDRARVLEQYAKYFRARVRTDAAFASRLLSLRGLRLGCFCAPRFCHGDIIAAWIDAAKCDCGAPAVVAHWGRTRVVLLCERCATEGAP